MARLQTYTCDQCGAIRKDANHWWLAAPGTNGLTIWPFSNIANATETWSHLCGRECVQKHVELWMANHRQEAA